MPFFIECNLVIVLVDAYFKVIKDKGNAVIDDPLRPKVGLALGGGAGLGWAHIGVIRVLQENNIPIDMIAGCSIGAIVGACVAADKLDHLEDLARSITLKEMLLFSDPSFKKGSVLGARKITSIFKEHLGDDLIEELAMPFAAVAADLYTGERVVLDSGSLIEAARASSAVPGVFPPILKGAQLLADGGTVDPIPVEAVQVMGAEMIIAVDLQGDYGGRARRMGLEVGKDMKRGAAMRIARAGMLMALTNLGKETLKRCPPDTLITPAIGHIEMADFTQAAVLIELGRKAALAAMPEILENLNKKRAQST